MLIMYMYGNSMCVMHVMCIYVMLIMYMYGNSMCMKCKWYLDDACNLYVMYVVCVVHVIYIV